MNDFSEQDNQSPVCSYWVYNDTPGIEKYFANECANCGGFTWDAVEDKVPYCKWCGAKMSKPPVPFSKWKGTDDYRRVRKPKL